MLLLTTLFNLSRAFIDDENETELTNLNLKNHLKLKMTIYTLNTK